MTQHFQISSTAHHEDKKFILTILRTFAVIKSNFLFTIELKLRLQSKPGYKVTVSVKILI